MKRFFALAFLAVVAMLAACSESHESPSGMVVGTGIVQQGGATGDIDCSGWSVRADSGHAYQLTSLAVEFQQRGLQVRFTLKKRRDMVSLCPFGDIADVVAMTRL